MIEGSESGAGSGSVLLTNESEPDLGGQIAYGSDGSGSATLVWSMADPVLKPAVFFFNLKLEVK
jgi:hypothetical protein